MFAALKDYAARRFVLDWLGRQQRVNNANYPQLCCYSSDFISIYLAVDGQYEREELAFILDRFAPYIRGKAVLDVGANIGNHAVAFAELAERVIAFEPHPITFQLLTLNARLRPNITPINVGASDRPATLTATVPPGNAGGAGVDRRGEGEAVMFDLKPIDDIDLPPVGFVKIDVEGHEERAFRGMARLLARDRPVIVFEQNEEGLAEGSSAAIEFLRSVGYRHLYEIAVGTHWRSGGRVGKALEALTSGPPQVTTRLLPVTSLEQRSYPALVATVEPLSPPPEGNGG